MKQFIILYRDRDDEPHEQSSLADSPEAALQHLRETYPEEHYGKDFVKTYSIRERKHDLVVQLWDHMIDDCDLEHVTWTPLPPAGV